MSAVDRYELAFAELTTAELQILSLGLAYVADATQDWQGWPGFMPFRLAVDRAGRRAADAEDAG